jgi:hypothetical protein
MARFSSALKSISTGSKSDKSSSLSSDGQMLKLLRHWKFAQTPEQKKIFQKIKEEKVNASIDLLKIEPKKR